MEVERSVSAVIFRRVAASSSTTNSSDEALEDGEQVMPRVFPVAPLALCRRSTSSTNRRGIRESSAKFSLRASHLRRLTGCRS